MINLNTQVSDTYTNVAGVELYSLLKSHIDNKEQIEVSFRDVTTSTSFLNSSFGKIIETYGVSALKSFVKPVNISSGQKNILKAYMTAMSK